MENFYYTVLKKNNKKMLIILLFSLLLINAFSLQSINNNNHNLIERIAFGSCNNPNTQSIWSKIEEFKPSRLILLGDNMYADKKDATFKNQKSSVSIIEAQYDLIKEDTGWKKLFNYLGGWNNIDVTYDDHDYGINNGAKNFHLKDPSQTAFWNFIEETNADKLNQDSVYSSKKIKIITKNNKQFIYKVIMLDTRSNKDKTGTSDGDFLGTEQWNWLEKEILDADEVDLILLGSSIQTLVDDKLIEESWGEFPLARERLIQLLLKSQVPNTVILSGDIHSAEIVQAICNDKIRGKHTLYELTSSGLSHTFLYTSIPKIELSKLDNIDDTKVIVKNRKFFWLVYLASNIYQKLLPHHYREHYIHDYADVLNFGLLDIIYDEVNNNFYLINNMIDHDGKSLMERIIPLRNRNDINNHSDSDVIASCEPFHGPVPYWKLLYTRLCLAFLLLITFVIPGLLILWLIIASLWYVSYGAERERRAKIEDQYVKFKKKE